jgi:hypothetical protein
LYNGVKCFQEMVWEQLDIHLQKMNLDTDLTSFTEINLKWITDINVKHKTIQLGL